MPGSPPPEPPPDRFDVLIVGAGPAGIAAACAAAARAGARVGVVDDNPSPGGQIWRGGRPASPDARPWFDAFDRTACRRLHGTTVIAAPAPGTLTAERDGRPLALHYASLILATGARERFLPFPGWTSPRVIGAGGLQALVKSGLPIAGKTVAVAGSGPLLLAVAATLRKQGARIALIAEQAPWERLARFALSTLADPPKLRQALALKARLFGVPYRPGCWPVEARPRRDGLSVRFRHADGTTDVPCDYLACGFFLVPNLELPALLGCALNDDGVTVDPFQQTTLPNVYAAGEATGIGGLDKSLIEGEIAGLAATGQTESAQRLFAPRQRAARFANALRTAFDLREELRRLPRPDTLVCRCEDVPHARLANLHSMREAKLLTRCGMGPCQGRVCGPACETLFGWPDRSTRAPLFPTRVANLSAP